MVNPKFLTGVTWLLIFQLIGEALNKALQLPVPGPVLGLILLLFALRILPPLRLQIGQSADAILAHLSLLFIPAGVGVILYFRELLANGWALVAVLLISTWVGLAVTALVAQALIKRSEIATNNQNNPSDD